LLLDNVSEESEESIICYSECANYYLLPPAMGRHLFVVLGTIIQAGFGWMPLGKTKICPKEMEK
jgi:hypothetical protein